MADVLVFLPCSALAKRCSLAEGVNLTEQMAVVRVGLARKVLKKPTDALQNVSFGVFWRISGEFLKHSVSSPWEPLEALFIHGY